MASAASEVGAGGGEAAAAAAGGGVVLHGNTALHVAALTGNAAEVSRLLAEGAEIVENEFGKLPEDVASNDSIVSVLRGAALHCVYGSLTTVASVFLASTHVLLWC